jgi:hypothetical protein
MVKDDQKKTLCDQKEALFQCDASCNQILTDNFSHTIASTCSIDVDIAELINDDHEMAERRNCKSVKNVNPGAPQQE